MSGLQRIDGGAPESHGRDSLAELSELFRRPYGSRRTTSCDLDHVGQACAFATASLVGLGSGGRVFRTPPLRFWTPIRPGLQCRGHTQFYLREERLSEVIGSPRRLFDHGVRGPVKAQAPTAGAEPWPRRRRRGSPASARLPHAVAVWTLIASSLGGGAYGQRNRAHGYGRILALDADDPPLTVGIAIGYSGERRLAD
jgi:hypothetical protein